MYKLTLVTPEKALHTKIEVEDVILPGNKGEMQIMEGHAPLVTTLSSGLIQYKKTGQSNYEKAIVSWGFAEITNTEVVVMAETLETAEDIDKDRAEAAHKKSLDALTGDDQSLENIEKYQRKLQRAEVRKTFDN